MTATEAYLMHINTAIQALLEARRLNADGRPFDGVLSAVQSLNIAVEEAGKASRLLRLDRDFSSGEQS